MKKILTIIGARPQFVKAAAISYVIKQSFPDDLEEIIVHTGQHYDQNMSQVFFDELGIPKPTRNLAIGGISNEEQITQMKEGMTELIADVYPDCILVYGDTNSTHAGALAASEMNIPLIHIEAGLRSFNLSMPEEINRIVADKNSTLLFVPTKMGMSNLKSEGFVMDNQPPYSRTNPGVFHCGDIMYDNALRFASIAANNSDVLKQYHLLDEKFLIATIHRNTNTDDAQRLAGIFNGLLSIANESRLAVLLPLHPRTKKMMDVLLTEELKLAIHSSEFLRLIPPVSYLDMIQLESHAQLILTDSGGVQKEAFFFKKPCSSRSLV